MNRPQEEMNIYLTFILITEVLSVSYGFLFELSYKEFLYRYCKIEWGHICSFQSFPLWSSLKNFYIRC